MAEKIRYYLEQSVPELEDLQNKGLFEHHEVTMIMRRRTDFEHRIQGRGSSVRDFLKYGEFETNLEKLRKKRHTRMTKSNLIDPKPSISDWAGPRRIFFIYQRGIKKYPSNLELWSEYLQFAKDNGAIKVVYKIYSQLLQLQPRNVDAWLSAAKYEFEVNNNAKGTRVLFQRSLRLNPESQELWLNYFQFELTYISKLITRRKVLGLISDQQQQIQMTQETDEYNKKLKDDNVSGDINDDLIALPTEDLRDELNNLPDVDMNMLGNPETNPALKGLVALIIFDNSLIQLTKNHKLKTNDRLFALIEKYMQIIDKFPDLNQDYLYLHILTYLQNSDLQSNIQTLLLDITLPVRNSMVTDESFSSNLQLSVNKFLAYKIKHKNSNLTTAYVDYLKRFLVDNNTKSNDIIKAIIKKCQR